MSNFLDSPKLPHKHGGHLQRGKSLGSNSRKSVGVIPKRQFSMNKSSAHNIVVVKSAANTEAMDKDPDLLRLQVRNIRNFHILTSMGKTVNIDCCEVHENGSPGKLASISNSNSHWGRYKWKPWLFWLKSVILFIVFILLPDVKYYLQKGHNFFLSHPSKFTVHDHGVISFITTSAVGKAVAVDSFGQILNHLFCLFWDLGWGLHHEWHVVVRSYITMSANF